tara:strand:+ start:2554 stop:2925 length:372 start_codon:yes stop_codon:yes gene_type:complete
MKRLFFTLFLVCFAFSLSAQDSPSLSSKLKGLTKKGDYVVLELRLNKEDEFRTMEGGKSSLARIAIYTGDNQGSEMVSKGFEGMNAVVAVLNDLKQNGWRLIESYPIKGQSLLITHYILERRR